MKCWTSALLPPRHRLAMRAYTARDVPIAVPAPSPISLRPATPRLSEFRSTFCRCRRAMAGLPFAFTNHPLKCPDCRSGQNSRRKTPVILWAVAHWIRVRRRCRSLKNWAATFLTTRRQSSVRADHPYARLLHGQPQFKKCCKQRLRAGHRHRASETDSGTPRLSSIKN